MNNDNLIVIICFLNWIALVFVAYSLRQMDNKLVDLKGMFVEMVRAIALKEAQEQDNVIQLGKRK